VEWARGFSWATIAVGISSAAWIAIDILRGPPQKMRIMNVVWPLTALYSGPLGLWAYVRLGRGERDGSQHPHSGNHSQKKPFWQQTFLATTHCGSGCTLGDLVAESVLAFAPLVLFGRRLYGSWLVDFVFAYVFGIVFQYFTIVPMRRLSRGEGIWAAVRADTFSLTAWQVGMYGWMAVAVFLLFHRELPPTDPIFWLMMQVAMLCGFLTAFPVNWWLLRKGWKETM